MSDHSLSSMVRQFYNQLNKDLHIACRLNDSDLTEEQNAIFAQLSDDIKKRYHGAGISIPEKLEGKHILDIGCGSGNLVFILSKLVGPAGYVVGVDLADAMIETAKSQSDFHAKLWGYDKPNFEFHCADAEQLDEMGFPANSFDMIVSNGVLCLIPDKQKVLQHAYFLLKEGGQFCLSDVYAEKDPPEEHKFNETLWSMGTTGALRWDRLATVAGPVGFTTPYLTIAAPIDMVNAEYYEMLEHGRFSCAGWRLFKLRRDVKQGASRVTYNGNITAYPQIFRWDVDITFQKDVGVDVDGELATILSASYFADSFSFAPASGNPTTNRNQNPFAYMDKLQAVGRLPEPIYKIE